jgi:hypothetical protein
MQHQDSIILDSQTYFINISEEEMGLFRLTFIIKNGFLLPTGEYETSQEHISISALRE